MAELTDEEIQALLYHWPAWAREKQLPPSTQWSRWVILAGRGWGKNRTAGQWVTAKAKEHKGCRIALIARTAADARDTMVEGESGLVAIAPPDFKPLYEPSKRRLTWPNGSMATLFSAEEPSALRGPQHHYCWADELASWRFDNETYDMAMFGLRLGQNPQLVVTTTPRPTALLRAILKEEGTVVVTGTSYENRDNLAPSFFKRIVSKYEGTRLGRQELMAEVLDDNPGALWNRSILDTTRVKERPQHFANVVVGVDPAITADETTAATGIVVCGIDPHGDGYVIADYTMRGTPLEWGTKVVAAYHQHNADMVVAEVNQGGDMVRYVVASVNDMIPFNGVHSSRGKRTRAEPISALFEQGRCHCIGNLPELEDELCDWSPYAVPQQPSPDRLDAMVHAMTALMVDIPEPEAYVFDDPMPMISPW